MSALELHAWLIDEGVRDELEDLTRRTVITELDNLVITGDAPPVSSIDWSRLLFAGSILARSDLRAHQEAALRIATGAVTLSESVDIRDAGAVLLGKLSNTRAIALAGKRGLLAEDLDSRLGMTLRIETQRRETDQAILLNSSGRWLPVNDFQRRLWNDVADYRWLSASAPTASGKTFLVLQWLIDQIRSTEPCIAVYLAPTRALVSEIESNLLALLANDNTVQVSSLPLRDKYDSSRAQRKRLILVLTQERLHLLANALNDEIEVGLLVVDEAHKIGDDQRGVILQDAVERISRANNKLKVVFISPATQNPQELLADAPKDIEVGALDSDAPTVLQNLIVAEQVPRKPKLWNLSVLLHRSVLPVGVLKLASSPAGVQKRLAFIAAAAGERGGTLVYANGAADAEDIADLISQLIPSTGTSSSELLELADLARKSVHPKYKLAALVERGVAFHYGNMPSLIRLEVERLFRSGTIRFLVCTSTLIEGVNLSCRTIVLRGPRKGIGHPMEPPDFWNLAGRAGRWGNEFQGNIICIDPHDENAWPRGVPARSRYPIKRESDAIIESGDSLVDYLNQRAAVALAGLQESDKYEHVGAYLLTTYLRLGSISKANLAQRHDPSIIEKLDRSVASIARQIEIGHELAGRHPGVSALGLQRLLEAFRKYEGDVENLLPAAVDSQDSYDRFITIMRRINQHLFPAFLPEGLIPLYALIVVQWLKGFSLAAMIKRNIAYHKARNRPYKLASLISQYDGPCRADRPVQSAKVLLCLYRRSEVTFARYRA